MINRGVKRGATSDNGTACDDSSGKRFLPTTAPDVYKRDSGANQSFDEQRAELAHKHVRALNIQFTSWVQSQLQNHSDELWEDGVQDYISHASSIMEKFSDVVARLRENSAKANGIPSAGLASNQNKLLERTENKKTEVHLQMTSVSGHADTTPTFSSSWNSGVSFNSQTPITFGLQPFNQSKPETAEDLDEENDVNKPSSPSVKKSEEKGVTVVHEVKCKVYVKPDNAAEKGWKDMGMGMLSIKCTEGACKATKESKPTIIIRNDVGKILLNASIYPGIKTNLQKNTVTSIFHTLSGQDVTGDAGKSEDVVPRTYLLRTKTEEETQKLAAAIQEYAPAPSSS